MKYIIGIGGYRKDVTLKGKYLVRSDEGLETKTLVTTTQHRPPGLVKGQTGQYHSGESWWKGKGLWGRDARVSEKGDQRRREELGGIGY